MKDYSDLKIFPDKKLRTLRNNLNNRIESFKRSVEKALPPSHMLHGQDEAQCKQLLQQVHEEMKSRTSRK